jgi:Tol biopolymer transport system component
VSAAVESNIRSRRLGKIHLWAVAVATAALVATATPARGGGNKSIALTVSDSSGASTGWLYILDEDTGDRTIVSDATPRDRPTWSPDAMRLAFSRRPNVPEIWAIEKDGSNPTRLNEGSGFGTWNPAWSPDGKLIAFVASSEMVGLKNTGNNSVDIWTMHADGSQQTRLSEEFATAWCRATEKGCQAEHPAWSPDSRRIAFTGSIPTETISQIYLMNSDGSNVQRITTGAYNLMPAWSPNGRQLAFVQRKSDQRTGWLMLMNSDGSGTRALTQMVDGQYDYAPTWNTDGTRIVFGSARGQSYRLEAIDIDGSNRRTVINSNVTEIVPQYSPPMTAGSSRSNPSGSRSAGGRTSRARSSPQNVASNRRAAEPGGSPGWPAPQASPDGPEPAYSNPPIKGEEKQRRARVASSLLLLTVGGLAVWRLHRRRAERDLDG